MSDAFPKDRLLDDETWRTLELFDHLAQPIDTVLLQTFSEGETVEYCIGPDISDAVKAKLEKRYKDFEVYFETDDYNRLWIKLH